MDLNLRIKISVDDIVGKAFKTIVLSQDMKILFFEKLFERFKADTVKDSELKIIAFIANQGIKSDSRPSNTSNKEQRDNNTDVEDVIEKVNSNKIQKKKQKTEVQNQPQAIVIKEIQSNNQIINNNHNNNHYDDYIDNSNNNSESVKIENSDTNVDVKDLRNKFEDAASSFAFVYSSQVNKD